MIKENYDFSTYTPTGLWADYMRETGSLLTHLGDSNTGQVLEYFLHYMTKKRTQSINELKQLLIISLNSVDNCNFWNVLYSNIFHAVTVHPRTTMVMWNFQSAYGSLMWSGASCQSEPVHQGEPVRSHVKQSFIYRGVYYFTELIEGPLKFLVQFLSCNRPLSMPLLDFSESYLPIKLSRKQDHLLKLKNPLPCKSKRTVCNPSLTF